MNTLEIIDFNFDEISLLRNCRVKEDSAEASNIKSLVELALEHGKPKATYAVCYTEARNSTQIQIGEVVFQSRTLAHNLVSAGRVFPFVATCGCEMDAIFPAGGDLLMEYCWDQIKTDMLVAAEKHLNHHLIQTYHLRKTSIMYPGSGDVEIWPIEQQRELFSLLGDVEGSIGVRLTESFLMIPDKTISGIIYPSETNFQSCQVCHRENCPNRLAAFDQKLWEEFHFW